MDRIIAGCVIVVFLLIGFVNISLDIKRTNQKKRLSDEFLSKLGAYIESQGQDREAYAWLIHRSVKMQSYLGGLGTLDAFQLPFTNLMVNNYQVVLNILPEIREQFSIQHRSLHRNPRLIQRYGDLLCETILRYIGTLDDQLEVTQKNLRNPLVWLQVGIQYIMAFPLTLLYSLGLLGKSTVSKVIGNSLFKFFSGVITLLTLLSGVITIVTGWTSFLTILQELVKPFL